MQRRLSRLAALGLLSAGWLAGGWAAFGGAACAQPYGPRLEDATIVGQGSTITIRRMPVSTPDGIVYRDITIDLRVDASGQVRADAQGKALVAGGAAGRTPAHAAGPATAVVHEVTVGRITETATAPEVAAAFTPGLYRDDQHGGTARLTSDGRRLFEGFASWELSSQFGDTVIGGAEWYGGPLRTNPHRGMVQRAGVTSEAYSYGVITTSGGGHFDQGMLIGAVQSGNTLTVVSFHRRGCCTYSATPTSQVTYTRIGN